MEKGLIEVAPLAYMRGRTLDNAYIILDGSAEYDTGTDEDVPDSNRFRLKSLLPVMPLRRIWQWEHSPGWMWHRKYWEKSAILRLFR